MKYALVPNTTIMSSVFKSLTAALVLSIRWRYCMDHLSLLHISELFQHKFVCTVKSSGGVVYGVDEIVFLAGTLSNRPYIAAHGNIYLEAKGWEQALL